MIKYYLLAIVAIFALVFAANEFEIFGTKFWGVRRADAQRQVFEQSQSYVEGKRQELVKLHHEWILADSSSKLSLEYIIRQKFANFDDTKIEDQQMYSFLVNIKNK